MDTIFDVRSSDGAGVLAATFRDTTPSWSADSISLEYAMTEPENIKITISVDLNRASMSIGMPISMSPSQACLAACAIGGVVGPLVECLNPDPKQYLACLKSKGRSVTADIIKCSIACVVGALAEPDAAI